MFKTDGGTEVGGIRVRHPLKIMPSGKRICCRGHFVLIVVLISNCLSIEYVANRNVNHSCEDMVDLFATECPANCWSCEDTESGTRCKVGGCDQGYAYKADDETCQR